MRWRSLPQPSQCFSASARSCTIRSRTRFFASGCRPLRFLTGASGGFLISFRLGGGWLFFAGLVRLPGPSRVLQTASVALSESCSLLRLRCASSSSRSRAPVLVLFPRFRAGVARTGPLRSSVTHRHLSAVCWDRWAAPDCRITATLCVFKQNQTKIKMFYAFVRRYRLRRVAWLRSMPLSSAPSSSTLISKRREPGSPQGIA